MSNFKLLIVYSAIMYISAYFLYKEDMSNSEIKNNFWDYMFLYFAPIGIPVVIIGAFFKVMLE